MEILTVWIFLTSSVPWTFRRVFYWTLESWNLRLCTHRTPDYTTHSQKCRNFAIFVRLLTGLELAVFENFNFLCGFRNLSRSPKFHGRIQENKNLSKFLQVVNCPRLFSSLSWYLHRIQKFCTFEQPSKAKIGVLFLQISLRVAQISIFTSRGQLLDNDRDFWNLLH